MHLTRQSIQTFIAFWKEQMITKKLIAGLLNMLSRAMSVYHSHACRVQKLSSKAFFLMQVWWLFSGMLQISNQRKQSWVQELFQHQLLHHEHVPQFGCRQDLQILLSGAGVLQFAVVLAWTEWYPTQSTSFAIADRWNEQLAMSIYSMWDQLLPRGLFTHPQNFF